MSTIYDFSATTIQGKEKSLRDYQGKVLLIVNTASKCGFTPQFAGLEALYKDLQTQGLEILGFPCNQFLHQDPGSDSDINEFCQLNYGVSFPMFAKVNVNGDQAHPLFHYLAEEAPGLFGIKAIKWNFTKFLVSREGQVLKRYAPKVEPEAIRADILAQLG